MTTKVVSYHNNRIDLFHWEFALVQQAIVYLQWIIVTQRHCDNVMSNILNRFRYIVRIWEIEVIYQWFKLTNDVTANVTFKIPFQKKKSHPTNIYRACYLLSHATYFQLSKNQLIQKILNSHRKNGHRFVALELIAYKILRSNSKTNCLLLLLIAYLLGIWIFGICSNGLTEK